jgi:hypothetical protein
MRDDVVHAREQLLVSTVNDSRYSAHKNLVGTKKLGSDPVIQLGAGIFGG